MNRVEKMKKNNDQMKNLEFSIYLPSEIIIQILSRLPVDSVLQFKRVCKAWRSIISRDPTFLALHSHQLISSSSTNGQLAEMINNDDTNMFVFNPVTKEYVDLPRPPAPSLEQDHHHKGLILTIRIGFGYHPSTNEYKVVRITSSSKNVGYDISIYTLGSGKWRNNKAKAESSSDHQNNDCSPRSVFDRPGVLLNGVLHWICFTTTRVVLSFDLADEELETLFPLPPEATKPFPWNDHLHLGVLGGCLCLSTSIIRGFLRGGGVDIWVLAMNKEEGKDDDQEEYSTTAASSCSWTKKFSISTGTAELHGKYELVAALESGEILFSRIHHADRRLHLVSYDPETGYLHEENEKCFATCGRERWVSMIPYMKSFVSLKELGKVGK